MFRSPPSGQRDELDPESEWKPMTFLGDFPSSKEDLGLPSSTNLLPRPGASDMLSLQ